MIFVLTCIRTQIGFRQLSLRKPDMHPIIIWLGCFIAGMFGALAGEWINDLLALRRARRLLREREL